MTAHYNAFISYKHAPEDNRVAEAVHKGLERFHIPHKIREKTGVKRISRIFRDKDELPITSDLSDSIAEALAGSDYLIVICSTNTKESAWVPREIEYFLKNHTKKQIFTVLVNGEPRDVIPEILTYEERRVTDENGNEKIEKIPVEPLSCDYRMAPGKAKRTELPRLACGIIGCAYDELMNRRRQYRMKQAIAGFTVALALMAGFSAYMYYSRDKIHKNYLESLRNQSKYLANESRRLLEKEQRITALQLALEALPAGEGDDRPVTAEAVGALTDAVLAYEGKSGNNIHAAWNYRMPGVVSDFKVSSDGNRLAALDAGNVIALWDTESHEKLLYLDDLSSGVSGMGFPDSTSFVFWDTKTVRCYDAASGEERWTYSSEGEYFNEGKTLMVKDGSLYLSTADGSFVKLNIASGKLEGSVSLKTKEGFEGVGITESALSPGGKRIGFRGSDNTGKYVYGVVELGPDGLDSGKPLLVGNEEKWIRDIAWFDDDTLLISSAAADSTESMAYGDMEVFSTDHSKLVCFDASDLKERWTADFVCNGVMIESGFLRLSDDAVAHFSGNVVTVYDPKTGEMKYTGNVNSSVLDVSDRDGDGKPLYITENGGYAVPVTGIDSDAVYYRRYFTDELRQAVVNKGVYARQRYGNEIIYYGPSVYDESWKPLTGDALEGTVKDFCLDEKYLAVMSAPDEGNPAVDVFTVDEEPSHYGFVLEGENTYDYDVLGIQGDFVYLGHKDSDNYGLVKIDIKNNKVAEEKLFEMAGTFGSSATMKGGKLVFLYRTENFGTGLAVYDTESGERKDIELPEDIGFVGQAPVFYSEEGIVFLKGSEEYIIDIRSGKAVKPETPEGWSGTSCFSGNSAGGSFALSDGRTVLVTGKDGKVKTSIKCPGITPLGITFAGDFLYVLYNDGGLFRYSPSTGELSDKGEASIFNYFDGETEFYHNGDDDTMYIRMDRLVDVIDLESGMETAHILNCFGHQAGRDIFITTATGAEEKTQVGYFKRYTVSELIEKAHRILMGAELPEDMKSYYGIVEN